MSGLRIKSFSIRTAEALFALLLVLASFGVIMTLVNNLFPSGSGLGNILSEGDSQVVSRERDILISVGDFEAGLLDLEGLAAVMDSTKRTVKRKPHDGFAWTPVSRGTALFDKDAVQTFKGSSAEIVFDEKNRLTMGESSLIIIQRMEQDVFLNERRSLVVVVDGELSGKIVGDGGGDMMVEVSTPSSVAKIGSKAGAAEFSIKVNPDKSSTVTVFSGVAELEALGEKIVIEANQSATVEQGGAPREVKKLPQAVAPKTPRHKKRFNYRDLVPQVNFSWNTVTDATDYRIQVARDPGFKQLIVDEVVVQPGFTHGNLRSGEYFWRVKAIRDWAEGPFGESRQLVVEQDRLPPELQVAFPGKVSQRPQLTLSGRSEARANVFVDGNAVTMDANGGFSHQLQLEQGVNVLVVEAVDAVGNVTYKTHMVYGKF